MADKDTKPTFLTELFPVQGPAPRVAGVSISCNIHTKTQDPSHKNLSWYIFVSLKLFLLSSPSPTYGIVMADSTNTHRKLEDSYLPKAVLDIFLLGLHGYRRNDIGIKHLFDSILIAKRNIIAFFSQVKR